jgi:hypothetical protein
MATSAVGKVTREPVTKWVAWVVVAGSSFFGAGFEGCVSEWKRLRSRASGLKGESTGFAGFRFFSAGFGVEASGAAAFPRPASILTDTEG